MSNVLTRRIFAPGAARVGTARHISAIVDETLRDTFDSRIYDARLYGGSAADERKAQSIWIVETLRSWTGAIPEFDPTQLIRPPACRAYGRNGAETISGLCGTRVVLAAPDRDTAQWSADSLGRSEVEQVAEGFSYGANTIRDGVSLTPRRELRALALPSEIMRLENLSGYLKFPGPFPVAAIRLKYVSRPKAAERFVPRDDRPAPVQSDGNAGTEAPALPAKPGSDAGMAIPTLPDAADMEAAGPPAGKNDTPKPEPRPDGPEPVPLPGEAEDVPAGAGEPAHGVTVTGNRRPAEGGLPGSASGVAI